LVACAFSLYVGGGAGGVVGVGGCFLFIWLEMRLEMVREPQTGAARVGRGAVRNVAASACAAKSKETTRASAASAPQRIRSTQSIMH